jgi:hypothetical protein
MMFFAGCVCGFLIAPAKQGFGNNVYHYNYGKKEDNKASE